MTPLNFWRFSSGLKDERKHLNFLSVVSTQDPSHEATDFKSEQDVRYESACAQLANEAVRRLSADNVTVLLVAIGNAEPS